MYIRAGPQSQNWSDQQNTLDPTGSVHKKARGKKFDPKKVDFVNDPILAIWGVPEMALRVPESKL